MQYGMKYHIEWEEVNLEILFRVNCLKQYLKIRRSITERKPDIKTKENCSFLCRLSFY